MTTAADHHFVPREPASLPELRAADRGVAAALESVLADNTRRTYTTQWRIFAGWCDEVDLASLPAEPLTAARYLAARANSGASISTLRLATSAISKAHEWAKLESPCRDPGVRASLKGWGRRPSKPQRQSGALMSMPDRPGTDPEGVGRLGGIEGAVDTAVRGHGLRYGQMAPNQGNRGCVGHGNEQSALGCEVTRNTDTRVSTGRSKYGIQATCCYATKSDTDPV